jgi:hypothetical protein
MFIVRAISLRWTLRPAPLARSTFLPCPVIQMRVREQIARLVQLFRGNGLGVAVPLEHLEDAHRGQRPPASSEDRLREAPDLCLREPGEQPGSELGRQDGDPGDILIRMDGDRHVAPLHLDVRRTEGGDLARAPACGDQGEDSSVAQSNGFAGAHPARIDAQKKCAGVFFVEMHQTGSFWLSKVLPFVREHNLPRNARSPNGRLARSRRKWFITNEILAYSRATESAVDLSKFVPMGLFAAPSPVFWPAVPFGPPKSESGKVISPHRLSSE